MIERCPFCGMRTVYPILRFRFFAIRWLIECKRCLATGPEARTLKQAELLWNGWRKQP